MTRFITVCLVLFTTLGMAQETQENFLIEKGTWSLEGDFSVNSQKLENLTNDNENERFNFNISPKIGYAISDNLLLGLGLGYGYIKSEFNNPQVLNDNISETNSVSFFSYIKKFIPVGKKLALHVQGEVRYGLSSSDFESNDVVRETKSQTFFVGVRPGISYSLSKSILLQANFGSLGYQNINREVDNVDTEKSNSFGFDFGSSSLQFGFAVLL